jgi:hypothetical protein
VALAAMLIVGMWRWHRRVGKEPLEEWLHKRPPPAGVYVFHGRRWEAEGLSSPRARQLSDRPRHADRRG